MAKSKRKSYPRAAEVSDHEGPWADPQCRMPRATAQRETDMGSTLPCAVCQRPFKGLRKPIRAFVKLLAEV